MTSLFGYILIIASILVFGYSLSRFIDDYGALQKKVSLFRELFSNVDYPAENSRRMNFAENSALSIAYVAVAYFADFAPWVLAMVSAKFAFSCYLSDRFHRLIRKSGESVSRPLYIFQKIDSLMNAAVCSFMLLALVL